MDGLHSESYYQTPAEFFQGDFVDRDPADTEKDSVYVQGPNGIHQTKASGIRIFFPYIADVGIIRQRYPIFPVHGEGSSVWKELNALKDIVLETGSHANMYYGQQGGSNPTQGLKLKLGFSKGSGSHQHGVELTGADVERLQAGGTVVKETSENSGETHEVEIMYNKGKKIYVIVQCDGEDKCPGGHPRQLEIDLS